MVEIVEKLTFYSNTFSEHELPTQQNKMLTLLMEEYS